jgi:uncharacterized protein YraI
MKTCTLPLIGLIVALATACSATSADDPGADETAVSAADAVTGRIAASSKLVTTTRVNLREGPSTSDTVITVLAAGTSVTVTTGTAQNGFYEVDADGEHGWVYGIYLSASDDTGDPGAGSSSSSSCLDSSMASKLVSASRQVDGHPSQHLCYRYVKNHMEQAGIPIRSTLPDAYQESAYMFAVWAKRNPADLAAVGLAPSSVSLASVPPGAILVWRPGQCGYSSQHGHIEIAIGGGRACSDFCGTIKRSCGMPDVYVPVRAGCE